MYGCFWFSLDDVGVGISSNPFDIYKLLRFCGISGSDLSDAEHFLYSKTSEVGDTYKVGKLVIERIKFKEI